MPARPTGAFHCRCDRCNSDGGLDLDGKPLGVVMHASQRIPHLLSMRLSAQTLLPTGESDPNNQDVSASAMPIALMDIDDPLPTTNPLWSRGFGSSSSSQSRTTHPPPEEPALLDALFAAVKAFQSTSPTHTPVRPTAAADPAPPDFNDGDSPQDYVDPSDHRDAGTRAAKAHLSMDVVEERIQVLFGECDLPTHTEVSHKQLRADIAQLQTTLNRIHSKAPSVATRRAAISKLMESLQLRFAMLLPPISSQPLVFDSDSYFDLPIDGFTATAQIANFIAVVCNVVVGVSRRTGDLLLGLLKILVRSAFTPSPQEALSVTQETTLAQIPSTVDTATSKFHLLPKTITYAVCPTCHCIYPPSRLPGSSSETYPSTCNNQPLPNDITCNAELLYQSSPIKTFDHHSFHDYLAGLLSQPDLEALMDQACDDAFANIRDGMPPPAVINNVFDAQFVRTFEGPIPNHLFIERPGTEGRYLFAFNFDFFSAEPQTVRGATASCGLISAACLNIPLDKRYKAQNMYIAGIVPGPDEPHGTDVNHYMRPVVDDFLLSWERGVHYTKTALHPSGRNTRSAVAISVNDLPAARKVSQCANHNSHHYCSRCSCYHQSTLGRTDTSSPDWVPKDVKKLRENAENWRAEGNPTRRGNLFTAHGVRWSELWRLPYWDPTKMLVVDSMHCLLLGLAQFHFRDVLHLNHKTVEDLGPSDTGPAFVYNFEALDSEQAEILCMSDNDIAHVPKIFPILQEQINGDLDAAKAALRNRLDGKNLKPLLFVADSLHLPRSIQKNKVTKASVISALIEWRLKKPLKPPEQVGVGDPMQRPLVDSDTLKKIQCIIRDTETPSWLESVPHRFGHASAGTLKADEWRTLSTVYLPIALVVLWGEHGNHPSPSRKAYARRVLDHTMSLVQAITLACSRSTTTDRLSAYRVHILAWVSQLQEIHPTPHRPNNHMAIHIYDFMLLFGPVRSWWCFPFERLIGQLQRLPTNHKFGQLESTMLRSYCQATRLKQWLNRPDCPLFLQQCKVFFDKYFGLEDPTQVTKPQVSDLAFGPVPMDLHGLFQDSHVALKARHKFDGVFFCRSKTHVGNSLVLIYERGNVLGPLVPASIQEIVVVPSQAVFYVVRRQIPVQSSDFMDPFRHYPHFSAKVYSSRLSEELEVIRPDWVLSHYARWALDDRHVVVLNLSRD